MLPEGNTGRFWRITNGLVPIYSNQFKQNLKFVLWLVVPTAFCWGGEGFQLQERILIIMRNLL